jgi:predicted aldo/keto reductase-like oxidoreductase
MDPHSQNSLSALGFGCMRFPRGISGIDMDQTEKMIIQAVKDGVNYFDTAYVYGGSEAILGKILEKNQLRDKIYLATKLPMHKFSSIEEAEALFQTQLERLKTDHIDYYLMHNLSDMRTWKRCCAMGIENWIEEKKKSGAIKQVGFSSHGSNSEFTAILDAYPWEFCQIQYNYMNTQYQAGTDGLKKAAAKNIPVIVMEPLLGGKLATGLPKKASKLLSSADAKQSPAQFALRWLWNQPEVTVVLSGMSNEEQVKQNIHSAEFAETNSLSKQELALVDSIVAAFRETYKIPCTGCNYCMPCPNKVNIPGCFAAYNMSYAVGFISAMQQYLTSTAATNLKENFSARNCIKCGKCEKQCPQHIPISSALGTVAKRMEPPPIRALIRLVSKAF